MKIGDKGICRLSVIPVRVEASDRSEQVTQLLFGDHYELIEASQESNWHKIRIYFDKYEGWIDSRQHTHISEEYYNQINLSDYKISLDIHSSILHNKHKINIVIGSVLPISTNELFHIEEQLAFNGEAKSLSQRRDYEYLKSIALKYLNSPYQWGGKSPFGIDCSGFVQQVFRICGYNLKRDASQQAKHGSNVASLSESMPGDVAFFHNFHDNISHVGIILEGNKIIHASGKVRIDQLDNVGILTENPPKYSHQLHSIKRIL